MSRIDSVGEDDRRWSTGDQPLVSLEDVKVHFEKKQTLFQLFKKPDVVKAVDGVSLDITENDVIALVGESGCGKTTLGKAIIGLQRPTSGTVKYRGTDIWKAKSGEANVPFEEIRSAMQIIHQDPGSSLNPNRRVLNILTEPIKQTQPNAGAAERRGRIYSLLERVGMNPPAEFADRYPHQLSGGEKQRVALSRALLMNPDLILADEAISALDVSLRVEMMDLMLDLQSDFDTSYVFISHDLSNARYFAQHAGGRIGVMYLGEIVEIGSADQIIESPRHPYTKVLRWATPNLALDATEAVDPPVRKIDIPDPVNPPSGCRFHTRCPEAREICKVDHPTLKGPPAGHRVACFRDIDDHEYWSSAPLKD